MVLLLVIAGQIGKCSDDEEHDMVCLMLLMVCLARYSSNTNMHPLHEVESCSCPNACELELKSYNEIAKYPELKPGAFKGMEHFISA